jgi:geranylgeranyl pyrophosphate synthase
VAEGPRNDLLAGKRTLPVLIALSKADEESHTSFVRDLDMAGGGDQAAVERAVATMSRLGAVRASLEQIERLRFRAAEALPAALADLPMAHPIRALLRSCRIP